MSHNYRSNSGAIRALCKGIKITGVGEFWCHEPRETPLYKAYQVLLFILFYILTIITSLELYFNSLPRDLHTDAMTLSFSFVLVLLRFHAMEYKKQEIRELNAEVIGYLDDAARDEDVVRRQARRLRASGALLVGPVYSGVLFYGIEGLRRYYFSDKPFVILAAYWPRLEDHSAAGAAGKVASYLICALMMASMICADALAVLHLIILYFRFILLGRYFFRLEEDFRNPGVAMWEMRSKVLAGILRHRELLRFAKKINSCFGVTMSLQVLQGSCIVVLLLLRTLQTARLTFPEMLMYFFYCSALLVQLALYMWNSGEVTYQASRMSTAIFHCGWHERGAGGSTGSAEAAAGRDVRRLVLAGCAVAQRPVLMKAFGFQELSYQSYVSVVRATYSLFAVLY